MQRASTDIRSLKTEKGILEDLLRRLEANPDGGLDGFASIARRIPHASEQANPCTEGEIGLYRPLDATMLANLNPRWIARFAAAGHEPPQFLEAGPRRLLAFDPEAVRAAVVTTGGLAPGLNSVVHSIVNRHHGKYRLRSGALLGIYDGFKGLQDAHANFIELEPSMTHSWVHQGGSNLGTRRYRLDETRVAEICKSLSDLNIQILYVIGGDGSMKIAHRLSLLNPQLCVVGIPKTMDNDVLWVWRSFGFDTAVAEACNVLNTLHFEARSTRRVGIVEFFGAESGFVVANASLASGNVDLVLVPEAFLHIKENGYRGFEAYWDKLMEHLQRVVRDQPWERKEERPHMPHAVVALAEGVQKVFDLEESRFELGGRLLKFDAQAKPSQGAVPEGSFREFLSRCIEERIRDLHGDPMRVFTNQPQHFIRAVPANANDQIYCERLGALAVDNALAGFTDCMVSQWNTEYVLVPLELVVAGKKGIPTEGIFWKQVLGSTGQPRYG
ncbi:MAG: 6-phosphofructokinase [Pseudomonadota bacterium]